jgi:cell division septum initiation protein DivIVA
VKLKQTKSNTSFYETFSDLIFATMAIFVLLMIVFMVQINLSQSVDELLEKIKKETTELKHEEKNLEKKNEQLSKLEKSKQSVQQYNFEVVIAVDTTGSMQWELDQLTNTIGLIGKILPKIGQSVKMGVIAYRRDEHNRADIKVFPLQVIKDDDTDGKKSFRKIHGFVSRLRAQPGSAPIEEAMDQALKMFSNSESFTGHQTFMLLGDVGPYEDRYRDQLIDGRNREQEKGMINQLKLWTEESLHRNLLILFSGDDEIGKTSGNQHQKFVESRKFFEQLATEAGQPQGFTSNHAEMIPQLLSVILK